MNSVSRAHRSGEYFVDHEPILVIGVSAVKYTKITIIPPT